MVRLVLQEDIAEEVRVIFFVGDVDNYPLGRKQLGDGPEETQGLFPCFLGRWCRGGGFQ
jgi:hypothetical protein